MQIITYNPEYEKEVTELWRRCNLTRPQNNPVKDIERKMKVQPELFLVGLEGGKVVASVIGGYDGHRGWVYYLGVHPKYRHRGFGRILMTVIEDKLHTLGCPKLNLQVRKDNLEAAKFYEKIGYRQDETIQMGKRLIPD